MVVKPSATTEPRWFTFQSAAKYVGVSKRTLENWEKAGCFRVSRVIVPGKSKGRALIDRESLDRFIEGYLDSPPQDIAMNANRRARA